MNKNLINIAFALCFMVSVGTVLHSQTTSSEKDIFLKRNIFHGSVAPDVAYNAVHIFYDRIGITGGNFFLVYFIDVYLTLNIKPKK